MPVACLLLRPWALSVAQRRTPGVPVAVLSSGRRVLEVSSHAYASGVRVGMTGVAALSRCPALHLEALDAPALQVAWRELQDTLYARYSPRVDGSLPGLAFLHASAAQARELATALHAPVGLATSQEVAHLAALRAAPGELREVSAAQEQSFLALVPVEHLDVLGLSADQIRHLGFLGVRGLADLLSWSAAQRTAFLGVDTAKVLQRFVKGPRTEKVALFQPSEVVEAALGFDEPLTEPGQAEAALRDLCPPLIAELRGRTCTYLTLQAETVAGVLSETRPLGWPLDSAGLVRAALVALDRTGALPLGVDCLNIQLSGLAQPSRQVGLWPDVRELDAVRQVLERFPQGLVRVAWRDVYAYAADAQYTWVDWLSGAERIMPLALNAQAVPVPRAGVRVALFEFNGFEFNGMAEP
jgi:nucleotidyltransferase/DNA polymerase involved in DNA repair